MQDQARGRSEQRSPFGSGHGGSASERGQSAAEAEQDRHHRQRRAYGLKIEKLRQRKEEREADQQGAVPSVARLDELDADQQVKKLDAGIARHKIAELGAYGQRPRDGQQRQQPTPMPRQGAPLRRQRDTRDDQQGAGNGVPDQEVTPKRPLRGHQQCAEPGNLDGRKRRRCLLADHWSSGGNSANAVSAARRCAAP